MKKALENLHPVHETFDGYFNTITGMKVSIHNPTPDMIKLEDIAHALSMICRFGGHIPRHYSVAQHSIFVNNLIMQDAGSFEFRLHGLMHDAAEAYVHDIIKPLKRILGDAYHEIEQRFEAVIAERFDLDIRLFEKVKPYDREALEVEHNLFFRSELTYRYGHLSWNPDQICDPETSRRAFKSIFKTLKGGAS